MPPALLTVLIPAALIATRLSGLMVIAPFWGSGAIPPRIKAGLVLAVTIVLYPHAALNMGSAPLLALFGDGISEFVIGASIGLILTFVFEAVQLAGELVGFQIGFSLVNLIDPTTAVDTSVMAVFHQMVVLYIFLQLDVHLWILRALDRSFQLLPLGTSPSRALAAGVLHLSGELWSLGLQIALPVIIVTMLIDISLGFLAKAAPQMPVLFMGISIKSMAAYMVLLAGVSWWPRIMGDRLFAALNNTDLLLKAIR